MRCASFSTVSFAPTVTIFQTKRPDLLTFLQSHAAKAHDRFAKGEIDLRRPRLGSKDKTVDFAAEAHSVQTGMTSCRRRPSQSPPENR